MKFTVVVNQVGEVVASTQAHRSDYPAAIEDGADLDVPFAMPTLIANPGQTIHELTVSDDLGTMDVVELHTQLTRNLPDEVRRGAAG